MEGRSGVRPLSRRAVVADVWVRITLGIIILRPCIAYQGTENIMSGA